MGYPSNLWNAWFVTTPEEVQRQFQTAAHALVYEKGSVKELWGAFHENYEVLCGLPLTGDYLSLFEALERWEASVPPGRTDAEDEVRQIAKRFLD